MSLTHLIRHALTMSPTEAAAKTIRYATRTIGRRLVGKMLRRQSTFPPPEQVRGALIRRFHAPDRAPLEANADSLRRLAADVLAHRFDLLGSGPVVVAHGARFAGFGRHRYGPGRALGADWKAAIVAQATPGNRVQVMILLDCLTNPDYRPIDWHVDFKSGYRWQPDTFGPSVAYGHKPGVDVKVPWELARLQHLPGLALAFGLDNDRRLADEFHDQVLDFLAANPPGWGVNWACPMDVAIRAVNIIVALDLFQAGGATFDEDFHAFVATALLAHARHVAGHLEWNEAHRGNHFLADICGLAWIAATLPATPETDIYLALAIRWLQVEIPRQFDAQGANFEASTAYHRLSAEMAIHTVAMINGLPEARRVTDYDHRLWRRRPALPPGPIAWPPFGPECLSRLAGAARFAADTTMPSGRMVQIGDNDSGRFLILTPGLDGLDPGALIAAAQGLVRVDLAAPPRAALETELVRQLSGGPVEVTIPAAVWPAGNAAFTPAIRLEIVPPDATALGGLTAIASPEFGLFLWRNDRTFISVRCGPVGQNGNGGHAHNDQLAVEIEIDGIGWATDPGTGIYTPDLSIRNRYRSVLAHFAPRLGEREPAALLAPFRLEDCAQAQAIRFTAVEFVGTHHGFGQPVTRRVSIEPGRIVIEDSAGHLAPGTHVVTSPDQLARLWGLTVPFSAGYGLPNPPAGL
ncbi:heparinase II/III domain-containing protein [Magnetospirillum moscoviense]|uniref:Uncharacterized protein n=1 Tax=Magnetospirillum moscoviense TaxID=1437059 RepID=A0A178MXI0_9PROT|nr:heparinase II/III family protein [Magnetospirillum moscoviense]OAN54198.1 hypothetical protein A6A05_09115 [Magnetospirillum moscoviense]